MKAITLWQPWATLIALGEKRYETRPWSTGHRGKLAIHAGLTDQGLKLCRGNDLIVETLADYGLAMASLPRGAVVCVTELVDCFPVEELWGDLGEYERAFGNFSARRFAWELRLVRVYDPPIRASGQQGLWEWSEQSDFLGSLDEGEG